ncbi:MAG: M48 family peptidase, partial [Betaproteobacteria bacterium]|nr:M48 family peptidase [Betaproteobacteria bacterium]
MPNALTWLFLAALLAATATRLWLASRQIRHVRAHREAVPPSFAETIPLTAHQKAADYTAAKTRFGIVNTLVDAALILVFTLGGGVQWLSDAWTRWFDVG